MVKRLPSVSSALLEIALNDLAKVEKDTRYTVDMDDWHRADFYGPTLCSVCFAGSVMAQTLGVRPSESVSPSIFDLPTRRRLRALNYFRMGDIEGGLYQMNVETTRTFKPRSVPEYSFSKAGFKKAMRRLIRDFKAVGL